MTLITDPQPPRFRLQQLIYDTRYRGTTIQVLVLVLLVLFLGWIADNTLVNLAARDKDISFAFLWARAGYDIDQSLIPYTNDSSHGRAVLVGLMNTLVVAGLAAVLATLLGGLIGILRLSGNWLIAGLSAIYIEVLRNVPLLLWIILLFVILGETTPAPRDFRAAADGTAAARMWFGDAVAVTNRGTNMPAPALARPLADVQILGLGFNPTVPLVLLTFALSAFVALRLCSYADRHQDRTGVRPAIWWQVLLALFAPGALLLLALGFHLDLPVLTGFNFQGGWTLSHSFTALVIALTLYASSFIAEIVRAGVLAVPRGQSEAATALGLRPRRSMTLVVLPQALRVIVPPMISQYLNITKNTTLGMAIAYLDLKGTLGGVTLNQTGRELECMVLMMLIYLALSLIVSAVLNQFNATVQLKGR